MPKVKVNLSSLNGFRTDSITDRLGNRTITVEDFFNLHEKFMLDKQLQGLSSRTLADHKNHMEFLKKFTKGNKRFTQEHCYIDADFFKKYEAYMIIDKQYKPCTINIRISSLKCYCNWLYNNKYTSENYALILKKVRVPADTIQPLTIPEIKKMLSAPSKDTYAGLRDFTIMIVILDTGIRIQELCNTTIDNVDLKNKLLTVKGEISKTREERKLPLSKQSILLLKRLINISEANNSKYVFMSSQTADKVNHNVIISNFEKYGKKAGLKIRCTPHVFRHTFATNAVKSGIDLFTLQKILGHNCLQTTRKYVQLNTEDLIKNHDKIDFVSRYLGGAK